MWRTGWNCEPADSAFSVSLCREWKTDAALKNIPFVFYTATYTEPQDETFAINLGADAFIIKPQEPEALMDTLRRVLAKGEAAPVATAKPFGEEMEFFRQYKAILIEARIIAVADVVESMASHRPYRPALGAEAALAEIETHRWGLYDGPAVAACLKLFREKGFQFNRDRI